MREGRWLRSQTLGSLLAALLAAALILVPEGLHAQGSSRADETELALSWLAGRYVMPLTCARADGSTVETEEAVAIRPAPQRGRNVFKVTFFGIPVAGVKRCYNLVQSDVRDRRGTVYISFRSSGRSDMGTREFRLHLETGKLSYSVQGGTLRLRAPGSAEPGDTVELSADSHELQVHLLPQSSDGWRLLSATRSAHPQARRLELRLQHGEETALQGYYIESGLR